MLFLMAAKITTTGTGGEAAGVMAMEAVGVRRR